MARKNTAALGAPILGVGLDSLNGQPRVLNPEAIGDPNATPEVELPDELAHLLVQSGQCTLVGAPAPARSPAAPRPRRISIEVVKAETRLIQIERSRDESLQRQALSWDEKRASYIASLPGDVRAALVALKVLGEDDGEAT